MRSTGWRMLWGLTWLLACAGPVWATDTLPMPVMRAPGTPPGQPGAQGPNQAPEPRPLEKIAPGLFRMGELVIDKRERSVSFPAQLNLQEGLLEYLLVHRRGKVHESLFRTDVEPYFLNIAFLLVGFEGTSSPLRYQGDPALPKGEPIEISVSYRDGAGKSVVVAPETLIALRPFNDPSVAREVGKLAWVYTGSTMMNGQFAAQGAGSLIAIYHDPVALVDNASPGGENDKTWFVKPSAAPPVGTPVTITIKARK